VATIKCIFLFLLILVLGYFECGFNSQSNKLKLHHPGIQGPVTPSPPPPFFSIWEKIKCSDDLVKYWSNWSLGNKSLYWTILDE
jgi:hypothetical protein